MPADPAHGSWTVRLLRGLLLGPLCLCAMTLAADDFAAGLSSLRVKDPLSGAAMEGTVFYPAPERPAPALRIGPYVVQAERDAAPAEGRFPLVVLSHGHAGSHLGHHDLATWLARHGYVVASVDHKGDNYHDQSGFGTDAVMFGRPMQISALIDAVLAHPRLGSRVDPARIGAAGFSAGGYTVLMLAGARVRFDLLAGYCQRHPEDPELCGHGLAASGRHTPVPVADARVKAIFAMAPLGVFFDRPGLDAVRVPVFLYAAEADRVLLVDENAAHVRDCLPVKPAYRTLPGAGHYIFLAPTPALAASLPELFRDAPGLDREAAHRQINQDALAFFNQHLGSASGP